MFAAASRYREGRGGDHSELGAEVALELCPFCCPRKRRKR